MEPKYFSSAMSFCDWLAQHGGTVEALTVGFYKRASGVESITWPEAVDEALCVGWVDGVRHRVDDERYAIRFTPRKPSSTWSAVNIERVRVLTEAGRMTPAGQRAFERRTEAKSRSYSYEQPASAALSPEELSAFQVEDGAWAFFQAQPDGYRKKATWWVVSAKRPQTREARLRSLIAASSSHERL